MARQLVRNVTRRIGTSDMVISIRPEGLAFRRHRGRHEVLVMWEELFKQYLPSWDADEVFATAAPDRWLPAFGDTVWAKAENWTRPRRVVVLKVLPGCGEEIIRIVRQGHVRDLLLSQVRPCIKPVLWSEPVLWSVDGRREARG